MTTHALDPFLDTTVASGFARRDFSAAQNASQGAFKKMTDDIDGLCRRRFSSGKKLEAAELASLGRCFSDTVDASITSLWSFDSDRPATRTRPKGEALERTRIHTSPMEDETVAWIWATRLFASRKTAVFETFRTPFSWTRHAAGRLYQRVDREKAANRSIAEAVLYNSLVLTAACDLAFDDGLPKRIALPCKNGLLLGEAHGIVFPEGASVITSYDKNRRSVLHGAPRSASAVDLGEDTTVGWRAITFIGENEMRPEQVEYADRWIRIVKDHKEASTVFVRLLLRGACQLDPVDLPCAGPSEQEAEDFAAPIRALLSDRRMSLAVGNDANAPIPPLKTRTDAEAEAEEDSPLPAPCP